MVTSALPGDGKTFTSINLALSMSLERDVSVLLVDCDVAKRHVGRHHGPGRTMPDSWTRWSTNPWTSSRWSIETNLPGFSILPAGRRTEGTAELLSSNRMRQVIIELCLHDPRRILLLDSPPLLITNEGRALLKIAGQVVLVMRAGHTPSHAVAGCRGAHQRGTRRAASF